MKKALKTTIIILGSLCIAYTVLYALVETGSFPRYETARARMAAEREKVRRPVQTDTVRPYSLKARRGDILDCKGRVLATASTVYDIHFDATAGDKDEQWADNVRLLSDSLAVILEDRSAEDYYASFTKSRLEKKRFVRICKGMDSLTYERLRQSALFGMQAAKSGMIIEPRQARQYPYGALARRAIGFVRSGSPGHANNIGIEGRYYGMLSGEDGYELVRSRWVKWPLRPAKQKVRKTIVQPRNGEDIKLTLDIEIQAKADSVLRAGIEAVSEVKGACLVLSDVRTGAIRSMVNLVRDADGCFKEYYNVAVARTFEPGSLLYPAIDIAARKCGAGGFSVDGIKGNERAFVDSLRNVISGGNWDRGSWDILGMQKIISIYPTDSDWSRRSIEGLGKGYGIQAAALDYLTLYTAVARGGDGVRLHLVERDTVECYPLCTPEQADYLKHSLSDALIQNVAFKSTDVSIAGKTGSSFIAQSNRSYVSNDGKKAVQSSFAGFFPADVPEYSIICMAYTGPTSDYHPVIGLSSRVVAGFVNAIYKE